MAFRGMQEYLQSKHTKQNSQYPPTQTYIFAHKSIYFNGSTGITTMSDIKKLVKVHGGIIREHFNAKVDFIIAESM
jgi:NAD-dependent DNA ligase